MYGTLTVPVAPALAWPPVSLEPERRDLAPRACPALNAIARMLVANPWGRGTGEGIGLSGHKNEYKAGVRIGNWVEEKFGVEAVGAGTGLMVRLLNHVAMPCAPASTSSHRARRTT